MRERFAFAVLGAVLASVGVAREAHAVSACTAADIIASEGANCPNSTAPCSIKKSYTIANGCILDFGTRAVTVSGPGGALDVGSRSMTIKAGTFTVASGAKVVGLGNNPAPLDKGGMIMIQTTGAVVIDKAANNGVIDVSGDTLAGTVAIQAGGAVTLKGILMAKNSTTSGGGGNISIRAGGDFVYVAAGVLSAGGSSLGAAGSIDIVATGRVDLGDNIDLVGADGGVLDVEAGADAVVRKPIDADGTGDAGSGGCVGIVAGTQLQILASITEDGAGSSTMSGGGCGGFGCFESRFGDTTISANILAEGNVPDGGGGDLAFISRGSISVASGTTVSARAPGAMGCGGDLEMDADFDVTSNGILDSSGGFGGGFVTIDAGRNVTLTGRVDASGFAIAGFGGGLEVIAGDNTKGTLSIQNTVDVTGGACSVDLGCGAGGVTDLTGCDVTLTSAGSIKAGGPQGGENDITAREQLTIQGPVDAATSGGTAPVDGVNHFTYPSRKPPSISGSVTPSPTLTAMATCASAQTNCLVPCPTCGNGVVEFPETCDTAGTPQSCDGCSVFCQVENCNDANVCTTDSCSPSLGCRHVPVADGTSCSDGNVCNGSELCASGTCLPGVPLNCSDNNPCTLDPCDPTGGCQPHTPTGAGTACSDNNACTLNDTCDGAGTCQPGPPRVCNDGKECTTDTCDSVRGCVFTNRTGACTDDGNPCTADVCSAGNCTHPALAEGTGCDDGQFCTVNEACHGGSCSGGVPRSCDDGNACTTDSCDETNDRCVNSPVPSCCGNGVVEAGEQCDDGNTSNTDACLNTCVAAQCGDGFVEAGVEGCDLGAQNSNAPDAACRTDCRPQRCGDGIVDVQHGEQCDDGNNIAGDGCSPTCQAELPATAQRIPGKGSALTDCALEWAMISPAVDRKGVPSIKQKCKDGTSCDSGTTAGECTFSVWICANNTDPHLPTCHPGAGANAIGTVVQASVSKPSASDAAVRPEDAANRQALTQGTTAAQSAPADFCGQRLQIRVPLKAPGRKGVKTLRIQGTTDRSVVDTDTLKLFCLP